MPPTPRPLPAACLVGQAKVAQQVAQHPVAVLNRAVEEGCTAEAHKAWAWVARRWLTQPGGHEETKRHRLLLTCMPLDTLLVAATCAYRRAAYKLTSLIVLGNLVVVLALLGAVSIRGRCRCRGGRPMGLHRLCSAAIASCSTWSRHVAAIGRPPGGWEGLQAKGPGGAEGWAGWCGVVARNYSLHALDGIIRLRNQAMRGACHSAAAPPPRCAPLACL